MKPQVDDGISFQSLRPKKEHWLIRLWNTPVADLFRKRAEVAPKHYDEVIHVTDETWNEIVAKATPVGTYVAPGRFIASHRMVWIDGTAVGVEWTIRQDKPDQPMLDATGREVCKGDKLFEVPERVNTSIDVGSYEVLGFTGNCVELLGGWGGYTVTNSCEDYLPHDAYIARLISLYRDEIAALEIEAAKLK